MINEAVTVLEWDYTPPDFFEEPVQVILDTGTIEIDNGRARGSFNALEHSRGSESRNEIHERLRQKFMAQQLFSGCTFILDRPGNMTREHPGGGRDHTLFAEPGHGKTAGAPAHFRITDPEGVVIQDNRSEQMAEQRGYLDKIGELGPEHPKLIRMLKSFGMSVEDEQNCFVHLYEVRDILKTEFGNGGIARKTLGKDNWNNLGQLANDDPNTASRHRGGHITLQPASDKTLNAGRECARSLILAYVDHLERNRPG